VNFFPGTDPRGRAGRVPQPRLPTTAKATQRAAPTTPAAAWGATLPPAYTRKVRGTPEPLGASFHTNVVKRCPRYSNPLECMILKGVFFMIPMECIHGIHEYIE